MIQEMDSRSDAWGAPSPLPWSDYPYHGVILDANGQVVEAYGKRGSGNRRLIIAAVNSSHAALLAAAKEAMKLIRTWHGMFVPPDAEAAIWEAYQASPEMRRLNAIIAAAEEPTP